MPSSPLPLKSPGHWTRSTFSRALVASPQPPSHPLPLPTHPTSQIPSIPRDGCLACNTPPPQALSGPAVDTEAPTAHLQTYPQALQAGGLLSQSLLL